MPQTSLVKIQTSHPSSLTGQRQINRHNLQNQAVFWVWGKKGRVKSRETIVLQFRFRCKITNSVSR
eukprot:scaffold81317_cov68-Cyclotella_meneghiniana.AAC.3